MTSYYSSEVDAFHCKVVLEKEIKLKELNFKTLHGILACNKNLKQWRIKQSSVCDMCQETQTIRHLLFDCHYVQPIWNKVNNVFNVIITFPLILGSNRFF